MMKEIRAIWLSDTHMSNNVPGFTYSAFENLIECMKSEEASLVLVTGDIADSYTTMGRIERIADELDLPTYFVLGNHDYWHSTSQTNMRQYVQGQCDRFNKRIEFQNKMIDDENERIEEQNENRRKPQQLKDHRRAQLYYVTTSELPLHVGTVAIIGADGWYDMAYSEDYSILNGHNDKHNVPELTSHSSLVHMMSYVKVCSQRAHEDTLRISGQVNKLEDSGVQFEQLLILTHVPPFPDMCKHDGEVASAPWLNVVCNRILGRCINLFKDAPILKDKQIVVLSGHTHNEAHYEDGNVSGYVAHAQYGNPTYQMVIFGKSGVSVGQLDNIAEKTEA